jgi:hypothetical protein
MVCGGGHSQVGITLLMASMALELCAAVNVLVAQGVF